MLELQFLTDTGSLKAFLLLPAPLFSLKVLDIDLFNAIIPVLVIPNNHWSTRACRPLDAARETLMYSAILDPACLRWKGLAFSPHLVLRDLLTT